MQCCNAKKDGKCLRYLKNWKALNYTGANLRDTFKANALQMISDLERSPLLEGTRDITQGDTRKLLQASEHDSADLIIFSPPYLNSFDYSDIYRPELFLGKFVKDNSELMQLRKQTLRSHVQCKWDRTDSSTSPWVTGIVQKLTAKQDTLWNANIPQMVSSYFYDMEEVLKQSYNFAITGRINPTNKKLKSIDTLDRGNNYYLQYFDGRISEVDKDYASTRIVFMLGNKRIEVVRNFFPDNTIEFQIQHLSIRFYQYQNPAFWGGVPNISRWCLTHY